MWFHAQSVLQKLSRHRHHGHLELSAAGAGVYLHRPLHLRQRGSGEYVQQRRGGGRHRRGLRTERRSEQSRSAHEPLLPLRRHGPAHFSHHHRWLHLLLLRPAAPLRASGQNGERGGHGAAPRAGQAPLLGQPGRYVRRPPLRGGRTVPLRQRGAGLRLRLPCEFQRSLHLAGGAAPLLEHQHRGAAALAVPLLLLLLASGTAAEKHGRRGQEFWPRELLRAGGRHRAERRAGRAHRGLQQHGKFAGKIRREAAGVHRQCLP